MASVKISLARSSPFKSFGENVAENTFLVCCLKHSRCSGKKMCGGGGGQFNVS